MGLICRIFNHKLAHTEGTRWNRRRSRLEKTLHAHCSRCGAGEPECWFHGWTGRLRFWWSQRVYQWRHRNDPKPPVDPDIPF